MAEARSVAALALALALMSACGSDTPAPTGPSTGPPTAPTASQQGAWRGAFEYTSCTGSGCRVAPEAFTLRLASSGEGVLLIDTQIWAYTPPLAVDVRPATANGATTLSGSAGLSAISGTTGSLDVQLQLTATGENLQGTVRYTLTSSSGPMTKEGRILFASRDSTVHPARFNGSWVGFVTRTQCSGDCTAFDPVLQNGGVRLLVAQAGQSLTGSFNAFEITGTAAGSSMTVTGHYAVAPSSCQRQYDSGMVCLMEVSFTASADSLDRLRGSFTYRVDGVDVRGRPYAFSAAGDLTGLARWP